MNFCKITKFLYKNYYQSRHEFKSIFDYFGLCVFGRDFYCSDQITLTAVRDWFADFVYRPTNRRGKIAIGASPCQDFARLFGADGGACLYLHHAVFGDYSGGFVGVNRGNGSQYDARASVGG